MEIQNHSQLYRLSWDHHQDNFIKICKDLLYNEAFSDVTLIVEGATFIKCHKVILAASSTYFEQVFASLPDDHIMVALNNDIKRTSMLAILEYIYKGEVNIPKSQLQSLIAAATNLKIKGLTDKNEFVDDQITTEDSRQGNSYDRASPPGSATSTSKATYNRNKKESPTHLSNGTGITKRNYCNMYENPLIASNIPDWVRSSVPIVNNPFLLSGRHQAAMEALPHILQNTIDGPLINNNLYSHRSLNMTTGILRNALGHGQNGVSQPAALANNYETLHSSMSERSYFEKKTQNKSSISSTYTNQLQTDERKKLRLEQPSTSSHTYSRNQDTKWKRYKQYSPEALRTAIIEVIFSKESALQSARRLKVPSRTLYDKVKKVQAVLNANGWNTTDNKAEILHVINGNSFSRALETTNGNGSSLNTSHTQNSPEDQEDEDENFLPSTIPSANFINIANQQNLQCRSPSPGPSTLYKPYNNFGDCRNNNGNINEQTTDDDDDYNQVEDLSMKKKQETEVIVRSNSQSSTRTEEIIDDVDDTGQDKMEANGSMKNGKE